MGTAPLGLYLAQSGFTVSAEDDGWNPATRGVLERAGVAVVPVNGAPDSVDLVVHSSAVGPTHPARVRAAARGLPVVRRGEMLAEITRGRRLVAIAGSHGKTTTTAMLITILARSGFNAGWVLGGLFPDNALPPARVGGDWVVAEIDESDGTIAGFAPEITVIVNLDWDHSDHYPRPEDMENAFAGLVGRTRAAVFASDACARTHRLTAQAPAKPIHTFGRTGDFQFSVRAEKSGAQELALGGRFTLDHAVVRALGEFNAANAAAALAVAQHLGAPITPDILGAYAGVARRQTCLHLSEQFSVFEDYAHHPTEIRALLGGLRQRGSRLVVVFQPHRYTRTAQFKAEFAAALAGADQLFLLDVYAASETPVTGGTTADIYAEIKKSGANVPVTYLPGNPAGLLSTLRAGIRPGDTIVFVGAGDIDLCAREFVDRLRQDERRDQAWREFFAHVRPLLAAESRLTEFEKLGPKTTMRVGGPARLYAEPANEADLQLLLAAAHGRDLPVFLLGRGSNLLVPDEGVDGLVICLSHASWQAFVPGEDGRVWAGAGLRLKNLCGLAARHGLVGFEFMEGIPATVGGALRMNAGAMGGWTFDVVDEVHLLTLAGEKRVMKKSDLHVDYRHCAELDSAVALGAFLRPSAQADSPEIRRQIETYQRQRVASQPREPSAGCIFKNPPGIGAGRLIDEVGLKGERVGDAEVSPVHANFIINRGHATSADVLALVRRIRERVRTVRGIDLQPEVMLFGRDWRDVL
jgi:UDP-N-acetylenolpyruvoylglucosamine reductase